jgi:hypothetical protein
MTTNLTHISNLRGRTALLFVVALFGLATATAGIAPTAAQAARVNAYADGPVLFLTKSETRYAGKASIAAAAGFLGALAGPWAAGAGAGVASIADTYIDQQVDRGRCLQVKMWYWNPQWISSSWYSYAPWCY